LIVNATVGAIVLLLIIRLVAGGGRFGGGWSGRFGRRRWKAAQRPGLQWLGFDLRA